MHPEHLGAGGDQAAGEAAAERPPERRDPPRIAPGRQELVVIAVEQRHVPFDAAAEAGIVESRDRPVAAEEHGEVDARLGGDPLEQRRLILDRVGDEIGEPDRRARHLTATASRFWVKMAVRPVSPVSTAR